MPTDSDPQAKVEMVSFFEVASENGKKSIGTNQTFMGSEISEAEVKLVEQNVAELWNSEEKHDLNSARNPPAIFIRQQKIKRRGASEILPFDESDGALKRQQILGRLIEAQTKENFREEATKFCDLFKDTSYAPKVLITIAKVEIKRKKYISFFTHSMNGSLVMERRIKPVEKALSHRFQKAFVFPYLNPQNETHASDRVKLKDMNQKKADYMTKFLCVKKLYDPNDDFTILCKDQSIDLATAYNAMNKNGKHAPHTTVIIREGGTSIYTNLEALKKKMTFEKDGNEKIIRLRFNSPDFLDEKRKKINHLVKWNNG